MSNIIGEELADYVAGQINERQKVHGSGVGSLRNDGDLTFLNSRTSWVKFASAVSISSSKLDELGIDRTNNVGMGLAKNNILFGGTSQYDPPRDSYTQEKKSNVGLSGYSQDSEWGIVPMPGIESVDIKTLNRGSIEKATIKLKAYSREQFDIIDVLYLRLGYTVLLEWGHSHYIPNTSGSIDIRPMRGTLLEDKIRFFSDSLSSKGDYLSILGPLDWYRGKYYGNYDGLLGKISNFSWSFNEDGSYDITVTVISLGDVIESLKSNVTPNSQVMNFINKGIEKIDQDDEDSFLASSPISDDISAMLWLWKYSNKDIPAYPPKPITITLLSNTPNPKVNYIGGVLKPSSDSLERNVWKLYFVQRKQDMNNLHHQHNYINSFPLFDKNRIEGWEGEWVRTFSDQDNLKRYLNSPEGKTARRAKSVGARSANERYVHAYHKDIVELPSDQNPLSSIAWDKKSVIYLRSEPEQFYMKFGELLKYIQEVVIPSYSSPSKSPLFKIDYGGWKSNKMYSPPNQISLDPRVCVVRNNKFQKRKNLFSKVFPQLSVFKGEDYNPNTNPNEAYIMNIYLNFNFITDSIKSNQDERGNVGMFGLLSSLCDGLNKALGGVNNLEPIIDKTTNILKIIDSTPLPNSTKDKGDYTLEMYGYNDQYKSSNFVRNINLQTAITPEYATMITVGATAGGYVKGVEATAFSKWNEGLTDRFNGELVSNLTPSPTGSQDEAQINYSNSYLKLLSKCYGFSGVKRVDIGNGWKTIEFDDEVIDNNIGVVTEFYKYLHAKNGSGGSVGFIPFKLSITLDGISGIKIYNKLHIDSSFLPKNYGKTLDLIVTGISHKLSDNDWETDIELTTMPKNEPLTDLGDIDFGAVNTAIAVSSAVSSAGSTSGARRSLHNYSTLIPNPKTNTNPIIVPDVATKQKYLSIYSTQLGAGFNNFVIRAGNSNPNSKVVKWVKWNNSQTTKTIIIKAGTDKSGGTVGGQLGNGADISSDLYNSLVKLQKELLKPKYSSAIPVTITAGNDAFHQGKTINSSSTYNISYETTHTRGLAIDLRSYSVDRDNLVIDALEASGFGGIIWHDPPHIHANVNPT